MIGPPTYLEWILDYIWNPPTPDYWYGLEREVTHFFVRALIRGALPDEAIWYARLEWDV
jgi:hypothetical protein